MQLKLCQSTNPLGKAIDPLQEDGESMGKEDSSCFREREGVRAAAPPAVAAKDGPSSSSSS